MADEQLPVGPCGNHENWAYNDEFRRFISIPFYSLILRASGMRSLILKLMEQVDTYALCALWETHSTVLWTLYANTTQLDSPEWFVKQTNDYKMHFGLFKCSKFNRWRFTTSRLSLLLQQSLADMENFNKNKEYHMKNTREICLRIEEKGSLCRKKKECTQTQKPQAQNRIRHRTLTSEKQTK